MTFVRTALVLAASAAVWLALLPCVFTSDPAERAEALDASVLARFERRAERDRALADVHRSNPEWDLMSRTFTVLAFADRATQERARAAAQRGSRAPSDPGRPGEGALGLPASDRAVEHGGARHLAVIDALIDDTLAKEREHGPEYFLMAYWSRAPFESGRLESVFVDGGIALMIAARQAVAPRPELDAELAARVARIEAAMEAGPVLSAESYPDECWTFCNTTALAALALADHVHGTDHGDLRARWVATAKERLIDHDTGLLVSSYTYDGRHLDGPEGSSLWMALTNLLLVDEAFAREQYALAKEQLGRSVIGFGFAREWPHGRAGFMDVDSGPVVPIVEASPGSSGLAFLGAKAFGDDEYLRELTRSLDFAAFPIRDGGGLRHGASNLVGDAVLLHGLTFGPLWNRVKGDRS
jgi:hypothetical protein